MFSKEKNAKAKSGRDFTQLKTPHTYAIIFFAVVACWLLTFFNSGWKVQHSYH